MKIDLTVDRTLSRAVGANGAAARRAPRVDGTRVWAAEHFVQFYETDEFLVDSLADFFGPTLAAGDAGIVVATPAHREALEARLRAHGVDVDGARADGWYVALDAAETLQRFLVDGAPDPQRFTEVVGGLVAQALGTGRTVRIFGEMVALLAVAGNHAAAIQLEALWNALRGARPFTLFCAYPMHGLSGEARGELISNVCAEHARVIPTESYTELVTEDDRLRAIAVLQQKAQSLEAEIAERRQAEERLRLALAAEQAAREATEAALRVRDEFLAIAAHELKTPLTSLLARSEFVQRRLTRGADVEPARVVQGLQQITDQANRLSLLIGQLLDVSRLQSGRLALECRPTDLVQLVEAVVAGVGTWTTQHSIRLTVPARLEAVVDAVRLEQVLTNLLDNAVKYSPDGGPIEVVLSRRGDATAELTVRDRGLGIPEEKRGQIFERYYQAHANGHRRGLGLGLYISRQIVELHGGEIRAGFPADGGSCFTIGLPLGLTALEVRADALPSRASVAAPAVDLMAAPAAGDG